jgi:hypothetical protein
MNDAEVKTVLDNYAKDQNLDKAIRALQKIDWPKSLTCDICGVRFKPINKTVRIRKAYCGNHADQA